MDFKTLDQERTVLETKIAEAVWKHRGDNTLIDFTGAQLGVDITNDDEIVKAIKEDISKIDFLPLVEKRNDINGGVHDIYLVKITPDGIHFLDLDNLERGMQVCGLSDLAEMRDRLSLLSEIEDTL